MYCSTVLALHKYNLSLAAVVDFMPIGKITIPKYVRPNEMSRHPTVVLLTSLQTHSTTLQIFSPSRSSQGPAQTFKFTISDFYGCPGIVLAIKYVQLAW